MIVEILAAVLFFWLVFNLRAEISEIIEVFEASVLKIMSHLKLLLDRTKQIRLILLGAFFDFLKMELDFPTLGKGFTGLLKLLNKGLTGLLNLLGKLLSFLSLQRNPSKNRAEECIKDSVLIPPLILNLFSPEDLRATFTILFRRKYKKVQSRFLALILILWEHKSIFFGELWTKFTKMLSNQSESA